MTSHQEITEIQTRLARWPRSYWLAGEKKASLMQNGEEKRREIAFISADHSPTIDLLTHAYADMQTLSAEVERLRASETEHERNITALEARYEQQENYHHQLVRRLTDAMEIVHVLADGEVYHDAKGGMLMVAAPDALLAKARALMERG